MTEDEQIFQTLRQDPKLAARISKIEAEAERDNFDLTEFNEALVRAFKAGQGKRDTGPV